MSKLTTATGKSVTYKQYVGARLELKNKYGFAQKIDGHYVDENGNFNELSHFEYKTKHGAELLTIVKSSELKEAI